MQQYQADEVRSLAGLDFVMGAWLIISPFILSYTAANARWNQIIFGSIVAIAGAVRYFSPGAAWLSWLTGPVGVWLIVAPFVLHYNRGIAYGNEIVFGLIIAVLSLIHGSLVTRQDRQYHRRHPAM